MARNAVAMQMAPEVAPGENDLIVDVGGNDGSLLDTLLGVRPKVRRVELSLDVSFDRAVPTLILCKVDYLKPKVVSSGKMQGFWQ